jgi:hypothetical protein
VAVDGHLAVKREGTILSDVHQIDLRWHLLRATIMSNVGDRTRWAVVSELGYLSAGRDLGMNPRPNNVGDEDVGSIENTMTRVDALSGFESDRGQGSRNLFDVIWHVCP